MRVKAGLSFESGGGNVMGKLRLRFSLVNLLPSTRCFVSFEATFVPVWGRKTPLENRVRVKAGLSFESGGVLWRIGGF